MPLRSLRLSSVKSVLYCHDSASQFSYSPVSTVNMISGSAIVCSAPECQPFTDPPVVRMLKFAKSGLEPLAPPCMVMSVWLRGTGLSAPVAAAAGAVVGAACAGAVVAAGLAGAAVGAAAAGAVVAAGLAAAAVGAAAGGALGAHAARTPRPTPSPLRPNTVRNWRRCRRNLERSDDSFT